MLAVGWVSAINKGPSSWFSKFLFFLSQGTWGTWCDLIWNFQTPRERLVSFCQELRQLDFGSLRPTDLATQNGKENLCQKKGVAFRRLGVLCVCVCCVCVVCVLCVCCVCCVCVVCVLCVCCVCVVCVLCVCVLCVCVVCVLCVCCVCVVCVLCVCVFWGKCILPLTDFLCFIITSAPNWMFLLWKVDLSSLHCLEGIDFRTITSPGLSAVWDMLGGKGGLEYHPPRSS